MKNFFLTIILVAGFMVTAQVKIGDNVTLTSVGASSLLELESTTKGFLPPQVTHAQKIALDPEVGMQVWCSDCGTTGEMQVYNGVTWTNMIGGEAKTTVPQASSITFMYNGASVTCQIIQRDYGGAVGTRYWLDRNLGASQVATSSTDAAAYGGFFQWGRGADGHQIATSATTTTRSATDVPVDGNFIVIEDFPFDWRKPPNNNLWQGTNGINNPCPTGFRVPTRAELEAEMNSWSSLDAAGAFASPLKLPMTIGRDYSGLIESSFSLTYWSSTADSVSTTASLYFDSLEASAYITEERRGAGGAVRCIKDY